MLIVNETRQRTVAMNFGWSLKPVFVLLAVTFGIELDRSKKKSTIGLCFNSFVCLSWLVFINIPLNSYNVVKGTELLTNSSSSNSFLHNINLAFSYIFCAIFNTSIHTLILVSTNGKWKTLWEKLQLLQIYIGDEGGFYRQLRNHTIRGLIMFIVVNIA